MIEAERLAATLGRDRPVLIAGPTASGKSALALRLAQTQGRTIVNADALQVWSCWRVLTARPDAGEEARAPHRLYGHVAPGSDYSVGHWLREVAALLREDPAPVIVGGTGLYLSALTEGLAEIPPVPPAIRAEADARLRNEGAGALLAELDAATAARIDRRNPARIQRAWEVLRATGRGLALWQEATAAPLVPLAEAQALVIEAPPAWLNPRIDARFDAMLQGGALDEARAVLPVWQASAPWTRAIGAPELVAHLQGAMTLPEAAAAAKTASHQYAKRQRTWFRNRLSGWRRLAAA
ncbi:MAG: tRNA (adenosine(37)-N6)-dimethylallyltransferase MiaA [Pseudomonadota bacterium]